MAITASARIQSAIGNRRDAHPRRRFTTPSRRLLARASRSLLGNTVELTNTPLGRRVSLGLGIFWGARFVVQLFGYSAELWRGKRFETVVHILFLITWSYFTTVFLWVALGNKG